MLPRVLRPLKNNLNLHQAFSVNVSRYRCHFHIRQCRSYRNISISRDLCAIQLLSLVTLRYCEIHLRFRNGQRTRCHTRIRSIHYPRVIVNIESSRRQGRDIFRTGFSAAFCKPGERFKTREIRLVVFPGTLCENIS